MPRSRRLPSADVRTSSLTAPPRLALALALATAASSAGCSEPPEDPREAAVVSAIADADMPLIRSRPALVAGKYERMARSLYDFYRGTFPLYLRDARESSLPVSSSRFSVSLALPLTVGDAHVENFGTLRAGDGTFALEPNDFDGADRYPYLLDLRRLTTGMALAARLSNEDDPEASARAAEAARSIARAAAEGYARGALAMTEGAALAPMTEDLGVPGLEDLFERSQSDHEERKELAELTVLEGGVRRLRRGGVEEGEPAHAYHDLPPFVLAALPGAIEAYRQTLLAPPPPEFFALLDAAREHGSGVASFPRVRVALLVRGPTDAPDDDVILELKELADSGGPAFFAPGVSFDGVEARVLGAARAIWARPDADPLWGVTRLFGLPAQIKTESEALKTLRVSRMEEERGTVEALSSLAACLGDRLARAHIQTLSTSPTQAEIGGAVAAIAAVIAEDPEGFADEQADASIAYADLVTEDWDRFQRALDRLGPRLGVPPDDRDAPPPELRALFGRPPHPHPELHAPSPEGP